MSETSDINIADFLLETEWTKQEQVILSRILIESTEGTVEEERIKEFIETVISLPTKSALINIARTNPKSTYIVYKAVDRPTYPK